MLFANRPNCEGNTVLSETDTDLTHDGHAVAWHPSSDFVAVGTATVGSKLNILSFDGTTLAVVETIDCGAYGYDINWHPDGNFLAVANYTDHDIKVYSWNGTDTLAEVETIDIGYNSVRVAWHPNGNFLSVTHAPGGTDELNIYSWNGTDTLSSVETIDINAYIYGAFWSHDGNYLAVSTELAANELKVYSWNGADTLALIDTYAYDGTYLQRPQWSLSDKYIFTGGNDATKTIVVFSFNGTTLTEVETIATGANIVSPCVIVSKGGNYLFTIELNTSGASNYAWFKCYTWDEPAETLTLKTSYSQNSKGFLNMNISYKNNYFACGRYNADVDPMLYAGTTALIKATRNYCIT